jgi:DNA-directed RNA polymerase subunit RPC12/RpoP
MIYLCKSCGKEISLFEIDFEAAAFCQCGCREMVFLRTGKNFKPKKKDTLTMILEGVKDHYKAA